MLPAAPTPLWPAGCRSRRRGQRRCRRPSPAAAAAHSLQPSVLGVWPRNPPGSFVAKAVGASRSSYTFSLAPLFLCLSGWGRLQLHQPRASELENVSPGAGKKKLNLMETPPPPLRYQRYQKTWTANWLRLALSPPPRSAASLPPQAVSVAVRILLYFFPAGPFSLPCPKSGAISLPKPASGRAGWAGFRAV